MLQGIKDDSEWLVRMVENLLSITKINSGQVKILKTPMALDELIGSVILKFKKRYPSYILNMELPDDMVIIPMDVLLIEQVILNMLENSIIHGKNISKLMLKITTQDNKAIFNIIDDGCGIPEDKISKIFSGYYNKGEVVDGSRRNAGIGLSVCATIIKAHGGKIMAKNNNDSGVTFTFILDMEDEIDGK